MSNPADTFTIIEPQDQEIVEFYEAQEHRIMDFEA